MARRRDWVQGATLAVLAAFVGGGILALLAGAPAWVAGVYSALGVVAVIHRTRRTARHRRDERPYVATPGLQLAGRMAPGTSSERRRDAAHAPVAPGGVTAAAPATSHQPAGASAATQPASDMSSATHHASGASTASRHSSGGSIANHHAIGTSALGYVLVSRSANEELEEAGEAIRTACAARRLTLRRIARDAEAAAGDVQARPALSWILDQLAEDEAQTLVVARLGDLTDTAAGLPELFHWLSSRHRRLIALDVQLDTATEAGWLTAGALAEVGGWERERISERTRRGLEAARSRGATGGRPAVADNPELRERIVGMREEGMTLQAIADVLNEEGVPTLRGGAKWRPSSVQAATGYRRPSAAKRLKLPPHGRQLENPQS
jgi:DNA invertase Pin-like site-specific DNA recombinase